MVVCERKYLDAFLVNLSEKIDPFEQVSATVHDNLIPGLRLLLNALAGRPATSRT